MSHVNASPNVQSTGEAGVGCPASARWRAVRGVVPTKRARAGAAGSSA
jgi:hypothetical protein